MPDQVVVTDDDGVRIVRMNRPEKKNALTQPMYAEMTRALREAEGSDTIRCVIFAGSPSAFCAGSDISDFQKRAESGLKPITVDFLHALVRNPKPLVAAVDGLAVGIEPARTDAPGICAGLRPSRHGPLNVRRGGQGGWTGQCRG